MKRSLSLILLAVLFCSSTRENVNLSESIAAHEFMMREHFAFVDSQKALKMETLNTFIECDFENRIEELSIQLSNKLQNDEITLEQFHLKNSKLKLIERYVVEFRKEIRKVNSKQSKVYHKPSNFEFNGRIIWKLLLEGITKIPKIGG